MPDTLRTMDASASAPAREQTGVSRPVRRSRRRLLISLAGPTAIAGVIAYVLAQHGGEIGRAADRVSAGTLVLVTALAVISLLARSEAVVACLTAMSNRPRRRDIHAANSLTFLVSTLNHYLSAIVRAALLRRLDRDRSPTIPQMILIDASTTLIEALLVAVLIVASAGALKLAWWTPLLAVLAVVGGFAAALAARRRFRSHPMFRGLEVLVHSRQRLVVAALMVVVVGCQIGRTLIMLRATGLHPSLLQAGATFVAAGVLSSLFAGPGAATAGAPLIILGHRGIAAAAAAGLVLSITALLAAACYAVVGGPVFLWRLRHAAR